MSGTGFGIPLVLRYLLEVAHDTQQAIRILERVPVSMCYTVTLLDARGDWATVFVAPDRPTEVTRRNVVTNFQHQVEWPEHARATHSVERRDCLQAQVDGPGSAADAIAALLQPPLYQTSWLRGYGTLYSAAYRPRSGSIELSWPTGRWTQHLLTFAPGTRCMAYDTDGTG